MIIIVIQNKFSVFDRERCIYEKIIRKFLIMRKGELK